MNIDVALIEKVVKKVLNDVENGCSCEDYGYGIFDTMDEAVRLELTDSYTLDKDLILHYKVLND